ncbi:MAG: hypothetical protein ACKPKO_05965, partial [Candidatus Fonsibacter sp.]
QFYTESGKSSSASGAGKALANWAGYPNIHDLTETGAHPMRWVELLQPWKLKNFRLALPSMNPDVSITSARQLQFGSDFIGIVIDAHNGLQMKDSTYTGLEYRSPAGRTMFDEYCLFMDELTSFSQVVYGYSPCYERFDMNPRLEAEAHACAAIANSFGHISHDLSVLGCL